MKIEIENLVFKCIIGILDFERIKKQKVIINLSFEYNYKNDKNYIDYSEIVKLIKNTIKNNKFELLEDALIYLSNIINQEYKIKNLKLKISKPNILKKCIVSLSI